MLDDNDFQEELTSAVRLLAHSIRPDAVAGHDETGGTIDSLTEAVMGVTAGLCRIAEAIDRLADAVANKEE